MICSRKRDMRYETVDCDSRTLPSMCVKIDSEKGCLNMLTPVLQHIDSLDATMSSVQFLQSKFPGQTEQEYRSHLGSFGITGLTSLQKIGTLSGGQKSRVAFAVLSLQRPHILLLDEVSDIYRNASALLLTPLPALKPLGYRRYRRPYRGAQDV